MRGIAPEAMELLWRYPWPGNVRELQSVIKQALLQATGPLLLPEFLPAALRGREKGRDPAEAAFDFGNLTGFIQDRLQGGSTSLYSEYQALTEQHLFEQVLRYTGGDQSQAAKVLGITRGTLRARLTALGIAVERPSLAEAAPAE